MPTKNYYKSLYQKLAEEIANGILPDGFLLPTETEMAAQHKVSRPTIGKVYRALKEDGLVRQVKGSGTFVTKPATAAQPIIGLLLPGPKFLKQSMMKLSGLLPKKTLLVCGTAKSYLPLRAGNSRHLKQVSRLPIKK
jgi:DNA-binding transcriptional regulator YhcF (GntR family)